MNKQKKLLSILLGLFGLALSYGVATYPRRERVETGPPTTTAPPSTVAAARSPDVGREEPVMPVEEAEPEIAESEVKRNIFEPLFPPEAPPVPPVPVPLTEAVPPPPEEILPPPPPPFKLLGYLEKNSGQLFFLTRADELFIVRPQEKFGEDGEYRLVETSPEQVVLEEVKSGERTSLLFTGQESGIEQGGQPFSPLDSRFRAPSPGEELSLPEPPQTSDEIPEEFEEPPLDGPEEGENLSAEPGRSPLAPGLIPSEPESVNGNEDISQEEGTAPSNDEVRDE